jgi:hypothetical protein
MWTEPQAGMIYILHDKAETQPAYTYMVSEDSPAHVAVEAAGVRPIIRHRIWGTGSTAALHWPGCAKFVMAVQGQCGCHSSLAMHAGD